MIGVSAAFKNTAEEAHLPVSELGNLRSLFPIIQGGSFAPNTEIPQDLPLWQSAVPIVCLMGTPKDTKISLLDGTVAIIGLNNVCTTVTIIKTLDKLSINEGAKKIIDRVFQSHCELFKALNTKFTDEKITFEKLLAKIKKLKKDIFSEKYLDAIIKDTTHLTKHVNKLFKNALTNCFAADVHNEILDCILDFQTLGVFLGNAGFMEDYEFNETYVLDMFTAIFRNENINAIDNLQSLKESLADFNNGLSQTLSLYNFLKKLIAKITNGIDNLQQSIKKTKFTPLFSPFELPQIQTVPFEYAQVLISMLSIAVSGTPNTERIIQITSSLQEQTKDPTIHYLCSAAAKTPENAIGYAAILASIIPIINDNRASHLDSLMRVLNMLFTKIHQQCATILGPSISRLPIGTADMMSTALAIPQKISDAYRRVIAFKSLTKSQLEILSDKGTFVKLVGNLDLILTAWISALASAVRISAAILIKYSVGISEKHISISKKSIGSLTDTFKIISEFPYDGLDYTKYGELLDSVTSSIDVVIHIIKQISNYGPASLVKANQDIASLKMLADNAYGLFEQLCDVMDPVDDITTSAARESSLKLMNEMIIKLASFDQTSECEFRLLKFKIQHCLETLDLSVPDELISALNNNSRIEASNSGQILGLIKAFIKTIDAESADRARLEAIDILNVNSVNEILKDAHENIKIATTQLVSFSSLDQRARNLFSSNPESIRKMIFLRMKPLSKVDWESVRKLDGNALLEAAPEIAAALPLSAPQNLLLDVSLMSLPLIEATNVNEIKRSLDQIDSLINIVEPLQNQIVEISESLMEGTPEETEKILKVTNGKLPLSSDKDLHAKSVMDLVSLLAYRESILRPFSSDYLRESVEQMRNEDNPTQTANEVLASFFGAAVSNGCFSSEILKQAFAVTSALSKYQEGFNASAKMNLINEIEKLQTEFRREGEITPEFAAVAALAFNGAPKYGFNNSNVLELLGVEDMTIDSMLNSIFSFTIKNNDDKVDDEELEFARINELLRISEKALKRIVKASHLNDSLIIRSLCEQFSMQTYDLSSALVSSGKSDSATKILKTIDEVKIIVEELLSGNKSRAQDLKNLLVEFVKIRQDVTNARSETVAHDELSLLSLDINQLFINCEGDPSEEEIKEAEPLKRTIATNGLEILRLTNVLSDEGKRMAKTTKDLDKEQEKALLRAISGVKEASQAIYLTIRMFHYENPSIREKAIFAARRIIASNESLLVQLKAVGNNKEITKKLKNVQEMILKHANAIIDTADSYNAKAPIRDTIEISDELSLEKLRLMAEIVKCRKALEIAEAYEKSLEDQ